MKKLKKNKILLMLLVIAIIAFLFGTFFITIISKNDVELIKNYIHSFLDNIYNNNINFINVLKDTIFSNIIYIIIIWLLGLSIIGIPIVIFFYFFKTFCLGFALSSFVLTYKFKGLIFSFIYLFPNELIKLLAFTLIVFNSIKISKKIYKCIIKKETFNNKILIKYLKVLIISLIILLISSLYETYVIPFIFDKLYFLIK